MSQVARYSIGEAAEMVGLSPHTLRSWERRYGLLPPDRTGGNRRRYTLEEVEALIRVRAASARRLSLRLAVAELELGQLADLVLPGDRPGAAGPADCESDVWRRAADMVPALIIVLDGAGRIVDANLAVARAAGMVGSALRGLAFTEIVDPYDRAKAARTYRSTDGRRRGWELNLSVGGLAGLYSFDCWAVGEPQRRLLLLIGREAGAPAAPR